MVHQKKKSNRGNLHNKEAHGKGAIKSIPKIKLKGDAKKTKAISDSSWSNASQRDSTLVSKTKESSATKGLSALQATFPWASLLWRFPQLDFFFWCTIWQRFHTPQVDMWAAYYKGFGQAYKLLHFFSWSQYCLGRTKSSNTAETFETSSLMSAGPIFFRPHTEAKL